MGSSAKPKILVTRPQPGADQTAARLKSHGFDPVVLPFTEVVPTTPAAGLEIPTDVQAILVTSANAIRHASQHIIDQFRAVPVYAVGDATKLAATTAGFQSVRSADGNAKDLAALALQELSAGNHVLYLCGETRTRDIEDALDDADIRLAIIETYKTKKVSQLTYIFQSVFNSQKVDAVLLYSSVSAMIYNTLMTADLGVEVPEYPRVFCVSKRAKEKLSPAIQECSFVAEAPREEAVIRAVCEYFDLN